MKTVYIANFDDFYRTGNYVSKALESHSVEVVKASPSLSLEDMKKTIVRERPDFVLYGKVMNFNGLVDWLKDNQILSVFWLYDLAWGASPVATDNRNKILGKKIHNSDIFFSTDGGHDSEWRSAGVDHLTLRQGISAADRIWVPRKDMEFDIVFIGSPYFGRRLDDFYRTGNYVSKALESHSVEVVKASPSLSLEDMKKTIVRERPDFVLYGKVMNFNGLVDWLKDNQILSVFWLYDLAWGASPVATDNRNKILGKKIHNSDIFFSTDGGHDSEWRSAGVDHLTLRQGISAADRIWVPRKDMEFDIVFIGSPYFGRRQQLIAFLKDRYGKWFRHISSGLRGMRLNELVQSVKIVVGDSFPSPQYWSNRVYEMTGRGGFLIHSDVEGLAQEFAPGEEIVLFPYDDLGELELKIDRYLEDDCERERIRINGFNRCPTYDDRVSTLLSYVRGKL